VKSHTNKDPRKGFWRTDSATGNLEYCLDEKPFPVLFTILKKKVRGEQDESEQKIVYRAIFSLGEIEEKTPYDDPSMLRRVVEIEFEKRGIQPKFSR
jgi:hypothetical protein